MKCLYLVYSESKKDFHHNNDAILLIDGQERTSPDGKDYTEMSESKSYTPIRKTFEKTPYTQLDKAFYEEAEVKPDGYLVPVINKGDYVINSSHFKVRRLESNRHKR